MTTKVNFLVFCAAILVFSSSASAEPLRADEIGAQTSAATRARLASYRTGAARGDYQAMRNYAFTWSTDAARDVPESAIVGCAWYAQILSTHKAKVDDGDRGNVELYCGRLSRNDLQKSLSLRARIDDQIQAVRSGTVAPTKVNF